jgi:hypothetical protein
VIESQGELRSSSLEESAEPTPVPLEPKAQLSETPDNRNKAWLTAILGFVMLLMILGEVGFVQDLIPPAFTWEGSLLAAEPLFWGMTAPILWIVIAGSLQWYYQGYPDAAARVSPKLRTPIGVVPLRYAVLLLLLPFRYVVGPFDFDLSLLILPYAAWLGYRFGQPAVATVGWAGAPLFLGIGYAGLSHRLGPDDYFASLVLCRLCADRVLLTRALFTRELTKRQLAVLCLLLTLSINYHSGLIGLRLAFGIDFKPLFHLSFFFLGLSAISPRQYLPVLVALGIVGIPLTFLGLTGLRVAGIGVFIAPVGQPYFVLTALSMFSFGRMVRRMVLDGGPPVLRQTWMPLAGLLFLLVLSRVNIALNIDMEAGSVNSHGSLHMSSTTLFLLTGFLLGAVCGWNSLGPMIGIAIVVQVAYPIIFPAGGDISIAPFPGGEILIDEPHWQRGLASFFVLPVFWYFGLRVRSGIERIGREQSFRRWQSPGRGLPILSSPAIRLWMLIAATMAFLVPLFQTLVLFT